MEAPRSRQIVIAGAGIGGLTAAIAFARKGFAVQLYEQAPELQEAGAGIQLSPNATRLLDRLEVLEHLRPAATRPERIDLRRARTQRLVASIPLGQAAETAWGAPYLVAHRADLQSALLARARREHNITLVTGARVGDAALHHRGATVSIDRRGRIDEVACLLLVGADGVHSAVRALGRGKAAERPSGHIAWRSTVRSGSAIGGNSERTLPLEAVTVFLHRRFHLVAYPIRGGSAINLTVVTAAPSETQRTSPEETLRASLRGLKGGLAKLFDGASPWTAWPIVKVDEQISWVAEGGGAALIGDAAHAMTPFAAQGAALAIEDAVMLAELVAARPGDVAGALALYEGLRRPRVKKVAARGRFNHFAWHARWPVSLGRDLVLKVRASKLGSDLDWLYGYDVHKVVAEALAPKTPPRRRGLSAGSG